KPWPSAQRAKIRHTTAAWSGFTRRTTWEPPAVGARDLDVVVAVDLPSGDVKRACLARERVVRPLAGLLALELGREVGERQHYLIHRRVERALAVLEVEEHTDAGLHELLQ